MCVIPDAYTYPSSPQVPLSYQASACNLSTLYFLKFAENNFEVLKLLENSVEVLKILENKLESLKLQENQPVDGLRIIAKRDQEGNNSPEIETLPLFPIHGGSQHDFFGVQASDLSLDHSVGVDGSSREKTKVEVRERAENEPTYHSRSYIPLNNEQNELTQGDIGETSNDPTQAKCNEFEELYANANEELYPGCDYVTRLDFMAKFTYFKVKGKLTNSIFNKMLEFFQNVFPTAKGYKLPPSYYAIKKTFKTIGLGYESIHACVNDCFLFRGDTNKDVHLCPVCNTSRWKDSNTPGKKVPKKMLRYFLIIPRLQRLYKSSHTAKEMTWHATGKYTEPGKMQHPVDGRAWKDFDTKYPDFAAEPRNVRLGLVVDGFNPFGNLSQSYSIWSGKDIDVYLRLLIDDLKYLWAKPGVETIDVATIQKFNIRAMVLWTINDFPARSSLSRWSGRSLEFNGETKNRDPPRDFIRDAIMTQLARLPKRVKSKHPRQDKTWKGWAFKVACGSAKKKEKCSKHQAAYSFTPEDRKKFCQFIKVVKLPDGFGSNIKHKVTNNDTNITGLKSHDCHIMMQRLLPYGLQQYLPPDIAKPLIELCLFFKQIYSQTLMVDDMLKAQGKVIDILCNL
ncbi:hypothetical protein Tco_0591726 [Tanacetum coccineum]